jgi:hypothetical protein
LLQECWYDTGEGPFLSKEVIFPCKNLNYFPDEKCNSGDRIGEIPGAGMRYSII